VFVNVAGGMTVDEPAADLAIVAAIASSLRNRPVRRDGGLRRGGPGGEVRGTRRRPLRVREAAQMGFTRMRAAGGQRRAPADRPAGWSSSASARSARRSTR
jgi:DNA repair protein RadA/Sms